MASETTTADPELLQTQVAQLLVQPPLPRGRGRNPRRKQPRPREYVRRSGRRTHNPPSHRGR